MKLCNKSISAFFAGIHLLIFLLTIFYINLSGDGQASLIWVVFAIIDFPVSVFYLFSNAEILNSISEYIYIPYLFHGVFGTIWWYVLPFCILKIIRK